jgi:hypothetical protein
MRGNCRKMIENAGPREFFGVTLSGEAKRGSPASGGASPYLRRDFRRQPVNLPL